MANTANNIPQVALANTFDQWRIITNSLVAFANQMRNYDYYKDDGNLTLANGTLIISKTSGTALSITANATISGVLSTGNVSTSNMVATVATVGGNNVLTVGNVSNSINTTSSVNVASLTAVKTAYDQGNNAYTQANSAYAQANSARGQANSAYAQANLAYTQANSALNTARVSVNSGGTIAAANGLNFVNSSSVTITVTAGINGNANIAFSSSLTNIIDSISSTDTANAASANSVKWAYNFANSVYTRVLGAGSTTGSVVLTNTSDPLQNIAPTDYNQSVTLPDATTMPPGADTFIIYNNSKYHIMAKGNTGVEFGFIYPYDTCNFSLASNSAAAGVWSFDRNRCKPSGIVGDGQYIYAANPFFTSDLILDANTVLALSSNAAGLYGRVYNSNTNTLGTLTAIRLVSGGVTYIANTANVSSKVLIVSNDISPVATHVEGVIINVTGTTLSVNTADTSTSTSNREVSNARTQLGVCSIGNGAYDGVASMAEITPNVFIHSSTSFGSGAGGKNAYLRAVVVTGNSTSLKTATTLADNQAFLPIVHTVTNNVVVAFSCNTQSTAYSTNDISIFTYGVGSSNSLVQIATKSIKDGGGGHLPFVVRPLSGTTGGKAFGMVVSGNTSTIGSIITVSNSGSIAISNATFGAVNSNSIIGVVANGNQMLVRTVSPTTNGIINILTNNSNTAVVGTPIYTGADVGALARITANTISFFSNADSQSDIKTYGFNGNSPTLLYTTTTDAAGNSSFSANLGVQQYGSFNRNDVGALNGNSYTTLVNPNYGMVSFNEQKGKSIVPYDGMMISSNVSSASLQYGWGATYSGANTYRTYTV